MKLIITFFVLFCLTTSHAATTATLLLKGSVPSILEISSTPETIASTLNLTTSVTNLQVGTITTRSNGSNGYKVTVTSANHGKLMNGTKFLNYQLSFNDVDVNLTTGTAFDYPFTNAAPINRNVKITYTGSSTLPAGDYTDSVTFTIASN